MSTRIHYMFWVVCLSFGFLFASTWVGCSKKEEPECSSNLDCTNGDNQICVETKCRSKALEGEACNVANGLTCMAENAEKPSKPLLCVKNVCKVKCTTNFDCKTRQGETCDTSTGLCQKGGSGDAGEIVVEAPAGKGESEDCSSSILCASGLDCLKRNAKLDEGKCWKPCSKDSACASGQLCTGTHCVPKGGTCEIQGGQEVKPCWPGLKCVLEGAASGVCLRTCTASAECPTDFECATKGAAKYCVPKGNRAGAGQPCGDVNGKQISCVEGHLCAPEKLNATKKICQKKCSKNSECTWPKYCSTFCTLGSVGTAKINEACSSKAGAPEAKRCEGGHFCLTLGTATDGFCYRDCTDPRKKDCPSGLSCVSSSSTQNLCLKKCAKADDCKSNAPATSCGKFQTGNDQICLHPAK